jgi:methane monooxygenase PmoA-like
MRFIAGLAKSAPYVAVVALGLSPLLLVSNAQSERIRVVANDGNRRVDVTIDGKPFTSYVYPTTLKKPTLYPVRTAKGTLVTRGFPLDPRKGERVDHPHHVGLWFNHGDVNGLDFWNNSDAIEADRVSKMGTIVHKRVVAATSGADSGELTVESEWITPDTKAILREQTRFVFRGAADSRSIDRITTLTALDVPVTFKDNKEGTLGMRLARELEQPGVKPEAFTDTAGKATTVRVLDNTGVSGMYESSEKLKGDAVWGTRGRWTALRGTFPSEPVTLAILDHPDNFGFPTYWHARGYGLFAANPLGQQVFNADQPEISLKLEPGKSVTFKHRILILSATTQTEEIEREYRAFTSTSSSR